MPTTTAVTLQTMITAKLKMFEDRFQTFNGSTFLDFVDPINFLVSLLRVEFAEVEPFIFNLF